jgi:protein-disulfide isomerase
MEGREDERERLRAERQAAESGEAADLQRKRRMQYLILAGFAAVAVVAALIVISQSGGDDGDAVNPPGNAAEQVNSELQGIPQQGQVLGQASAPVTVTEFGDPQCPVCAAFAGQIVPQLIANEVRPGNAKYEFQPYLIIGPDSKPAMRAVLAAGEQGRFFNYLQLFYLNQGQENSGYVTDDFLTQIADGAGVPDVDKWNQSRKDSKWDPILSNGTKQAESLGFNGTPSILVKGPNGTKALPGFTLQEIQAAIQQVS